LAELQLVEMGFLAISGACSRRPFGAAPIIVMALFRG